MSAARYPYYYKHVYNSSKICTLLGINPCAINNGGCAHLCLLSNTDQRNYTCACHSGTQLDLNGRDCNGKTALLGRVCIHVNNNYCIHYTGGRVTVTRVIQGIISTSNSNCVFLCMVYAWVHCNGIMVWRYNPYALVTVLYSYSWFVLQYHKPDIREY